MIGVKNKGYVLPLYDSLSKQVRCNVHDCNFKGIDSPVNSLPPWGVKYYNPTGSILGFQWRLKSHCDPNFEYEIPANLIEQNTEGDYTHIQYLGGTFDTQPAGSYYFELEFDGKVCYSEEMHMCDQNGFCGQESVGLTVTFEPIGCCSEFPLPQTLPTQDQRVRVYYRNLGSSWAVYNFGQALAPYLINNLGAANLVWSHVLTDTATNNPVSWVIGGGATDIFAYATISDSINEVLLEGSVSFDWLCPSDNRLHNITLSWSKTLTQAVHGQNNTWAFDYEDVDCEDNTPNTLAIITANDSITSPIVSQSIDQFIGFNWVTIGVDSATITLGPSPGSVFLRRAVVTECSPDLQFSDTYNF